jgi:mono/diheme cytochrome c family protein
VRIPAVLVLLVWSLSAAGQDDAQRGNALYETHCGGCHHERLHDEVSRWAPQTARRFTLDEREAVLQHLNQSH